MSFRAELRKGQNRLSIFFLNYNLELSYNIKNNISSAQKNILVSVNQQFYQNPGPISQIPIIQCVSFVTGLALNYYNQQKSLK